jgi:tRNA/rRNA methyltransferase
MKITENIRVVLVHPSEDKNIGLVARAMKTMGLRSLTLISGRRPDFREAGITAVHARDILDECRVVPSLEEAVENSVFIAGITRRLGKFRKYFFLTPEQLAQRAAGITQGTVSLVFGTEKHGLSDAELALCHVAVHIPSSPLFPSLNLSHAVQIIAYVLFRYRTPRALEPGSFSPIPKTRIDALAAEITTGLKNLGIYRQAPYRDIGVFFQDILARAQLSQEEAGRLDSIISQAMGILNR